MTVSVESWQTIMNYPDRSAGLFADLCTDGDIESVRNGLDAGILGRVHSSGGEGRLLVSLLGLFDGEPNDGRAIEKQAVVTRCLQSFAGPAAGLDAMITIIHKITDAPGGHDEVSLLAKLRALAAAGVNGHQQPSEDKISPIGFLFRQLVRNETWVAFASATRVLDALFGSRPITSLRDEPGIAPSSHAQLFMDRRVSFFEEAIIRNYEPIIAWAAARVPDDDREVWMQMGDQVLHMLGISIDGHGSVKRKDPWADSSREKEAIQGAYRLIGAGAKMRHGQAAWDAVIDRPGGSSVEKTFFHIVQGGSTQIPPNGEAVQIIAALIKEGGLDVNAYSAAGETMLMYVAHASNEPMVEMLLANGADARALSRNEQSAPALAYFYSRSDFAKSRIDGSRVEAMLKAASARQAIESTLKRGFTP